MTDCALNKKPKDETCLETDQIELIAKYIGTDNSLNKIKKATNCDKDECILEKAPLPETAKEKIIRESFKVPTASFDHNHWLNNTEIDTIISQLRYMFPNFTHGFIHMIDLISFPPANIKSFDYPVYPCNEIDFGKEFKHSFIQQGILKDDSFNFKPKLKTIDNSPVKSYGIVCNTDSSTGSGQHWFVIYISTSQKDPNNNGKPWIRIECFNSAGGGSTKKEFNDFWNLQAMNIAKETGLKCTFDTITNIQHQSDNTGNCGSYSLFYIYCRLNGIPPSDFNNPNKPIKDYAMQKFRSVCFKLDKDALF